MLKLFQSHLPRGLNPSLPGLDGTTSCESSSTNTSSQEEPASVPSPSSSALPLVAPPLESVDPQNDPNNPTFWSSWADRLRAQLDASLPSWNTVENDDTQDSSLSGAAAVVQRGGDGLSSSRGPPRDALLRALEAHTEALDALQQAQELRDALAKQPVDKAQLDKAVKLVDAALKTVDATDAALQALAPVLLQSDPDLQHLASRCYDDSSLLQYTLIVNATPESLAEWCDKGGDTSTQQLLHLFLTPALLRKFFQATDAGWGLHCGRAIQIWTELTQLTKVDGGGPQKDDPNCAVAARLALAVALEFCGPELDSHAVERNPLDPVARFRHYQRAYQEGELDPAFATFTVWELRMAINSDATEDELQWGRTCLRNYRPDIAAPDYDPHWRYSFLVRTDVDYKQPEWFKPHHSYDQILSGGGECGPRAWFGRFMCKAFGIPTWGVRQPGHAALTRWTPTGWVTNLGAGFAVSDWDGRCGTDFELETQARTATKCGDAEYRRRVFRLELLARFRGESDQSVRSRCQPDAGNPWFALSLLQRKLLAAAPPDPPGPPRHVVVPGEQLVRSLYFAFSSVIASAPSTPERVLPHQDGSILVPASAAAIDKSNAGKASILDSWGGGHQLLLSHDGEARFSVALPAPPSTAAAASTMSFHLTMLVCTVHRLAEPLLLTVDQTNDSIDDSSSPTLSPISIEIALPYTVGAWKETDPVEVDFPPATTRIVLKVKRQEPKLGLSIQFLKLVPCNTAIATTEVPKQ